MKFIYKTKNLALTALVGAALAMGTPAAMAQNVDDNVTPTPDDQTSTDDYNSDVDLLKYYLDFVKYESAKYQQEYPDLYEEVFAPTVDDVIKQVEEMLQKVEDANKAATEEGTAYVSPITEEFKEDLFKEFKELAANAIYIRVAEEQDKVQALGTALNDKITELSAIYEENVAEQVVNKDAEAFFLDEEGSDAIVAKLQAMEGEIAKAAEYAQQVDFEKFESPVTEEWIAEMNGEINNFAATCQERLDKAQEMIAEHDKSVEEVQALEEKAQSAFAAVIENAKAILGDEIEFTADDEEFFGDEPDYDPVLEAIEAYGAAMVEAAEAAQKANWQSYDNKTLAEKAAAVDDAITVYQGEAAKLVANAQDMLARHDADVDAIQALENELAAAQEKISEKYNETVGEDSEIDNTDMELVTNAEGFEAIQAQIEDLRTAMVAAYDEAAEDHWQSYSEVVGQETVTGIKDEIAQYEETGLNRIDNALGTIAQHDKDVEVVVGAEEALAQKLQEVQALYAEKLEPGIGEPTEEFEAFFYDEEKFESLQQSIEGLRTKVATAYEKAVEDNMSHYDSPVPENWMTLFNTELEGYYQVCQDRIDGAYDNVLLHDKDIEQIQALETELAAAQEEVAKKYNATVGEDVELDEEDEALVTNAAAAEAIQAQIEKLRASMVEAYDKAAADNWQSYTAAVTEEAVAGIQNEITQYQEAALGHVDTALAVIEQHDKDVATLSALENKLMAAVQKAQELYAENLEPELGEPTDEAEDFFYDQEAFDALQNVIDNTRKALVAAYDAALADDLKSYESPVTDELVADFDAKLQEYADDCEYRINNSQAQLQLHGEDADRIAEVGTKLADAFNSIVENLQSKLGEDELTPEQEAFFTGEETYNEIAAQIEALHAKVVEAYDAAAADNWQKYESPLTDNITPLDEAILQYKEDTEYLADNAQANMQNHNEDVSYLMGLEEELANAAQAIADKYNETVGEDVELDPEEEAIVINEAAFDAIQAKIEELRKAVVEEYDKAAADNWQSYSQEATGVEEAAQGIYEEIVAYQEAGINRVDLAFGTLAQHDADVAALMGVEGQLMSAIQQAQALYAEKLEPELGELTEEQEDFFYDQAGADAVQKLVDDARKAMVEAYDAALADGLESYQSPVNEEFKANVEAELQAYIDTTEYRINNAQAQLQLHDEDVELVQALDSELFNAVVAAQTHVMELLGVDELTDEEEEFFLDEKTYDALSAQIDALRQSVVAAYDQAAADNWQNYNQEASGVKEKAQELYEAIVNYQEQCEYLADNAQAQMQLHDEDVDLIQALDTELFNTVVGVQEMMQEKLGEEIEINDAMAAFFQDEDTFDAIQGEIDTLRQSVVAAYDKAAADNWQNYDQEASGVKEHAQDVYDQIMAYKDECEYRVNNALANIQLHGEDADMIFELEAALQAAFDEVATEADDNIDADILEGIRDFLVVDGYDEVLKQIEALRAAMVQQYDIAAAKNWQQYEEQVVPNANAVDEAIAQYKEESGSRVLNALASIEAHQYDLDVLLPLDEMLGDGIAELMEEHPELFEDGSEFIDQYEDLSGKIEEIWKEIAAAATEAEADNWQSYKSVFADTDVESLYAEVEDFLANAWGDAGTINLHRWDADNNAVLELESMLVAAVDYIQQTNPDFDVDPDFDAIQAAIDALRHQMADAYEAADAVAWESYECPYTQADLDAVKGMIDEMIAHAQGTSAIEGVNASDEQPMIFSVDGKRLNAPIKGELNIFIYKNRVEKKIVK